MQVDPFYGQTIEGWNVSAPLHVAARDGDLRMVAACIQKRPSLVHNRDGWYGKTPLHLAKTADVAKLLIRYGADVNAFDKFGTTPLHEVETLEVAHVLIQHGANVNAANEQRRTVLQDVVGSDRVEIARFLIEQGADAHTTVDGETLLNSAFSVEMAQLLIDQGVSIEPLADEEHDPSTPLMQAAGRGLKEVVEFLLGVGANIHASTCSGTALVRALYWGHLDVAAILLRAGADVNVIEWEGNGPMHYVAKYAAAKRAEGMRERNRLSPVEMAHLLVEHGIDLSVRNRHGELPIHIAQSENATELIGVLESYMARLDDPFPPLPGPPQSERIQMHPTRQEAVTTLRYGGLARWSLAGKPLLLARAQTIHPHFHHLAVSPDGMMVAVAYANTVELRKWDNLELITQISLGEATIQKALLFSPDSRWLAINVCHTRSAGRYVETNLSVKFIEWESGRTILEIDDVGSVAWMSFDRSSRLLACGGVVQNVRVGVYRLAENEKSAELVWTDAEKREEAEPGSEEQVTLRLCWDLLKKLPRALLHLPPAEEANQEIDPDLYWRPLFLVHGAISPDSRWLAYFGTEEYTWEDHLGVVALHALETGEHRWHTILDRATVGAGRLIPRDYFDAANHTEVLFISETLLVCGVTAGALLFFDVATGNLTRRHYLDPRADLLSLALDRSSNTLWAVLSDGRLVSIALNLL